MHEYIQVAMRGGQRLPLRLTIFSFLLMQFVHAGTISSSANTASSSSSSSSSAAVIVPEPQQEQQHSSSPRDSSSNDTIKKKKKMQKQKTITADASSSSSFVSASSTGVSSTTMLRIQHEWKDAIQAGIAFDWKKKIPVRFRTRQHLYMGPLKINSPFHWHFSFTGVSNSPYENGVYHGRVILPSNYPFRPPRIAIWTPNGRFIEFHDICLTASHYHPESWQPSAWNIRNLIEALRFHMLSNSSHEIGGITTASLETRIRFARLSRSWKMNIAPGIIVDHAHMIQQGWFTTTTNTTEPPKRTTTITPSVQSTTTSSPKKNNNEHLYGISQVIQEKDMNDVTTSTTATFVKRQSPARNHQSHMIVHNNPLHGQQQHPLNSTSFQHTNNIDSSNNKKKNVSYLHVNSRKRSKKKNKKKIHRLPETNQFRVDHKVDNNVGTDNHHHHQAVVSRPSSTLTKTSRRESELFKPFSQWVVSLSQKRSWIVLLCSCWLVWRLLLQ